ncbi:DUF6777 domain-containing protein [Streptomyces sp. KLOTTS4A1]|uniref:DUF6777 domain-containing protein n=1 Tax=Streptomyces sp. KLOTTS4A1 TaxID=3390996 RepID=UPI0039F5ABE3
MHSPSRRYATALAISGALLVAGCSGSGENEAGETGSDKEVFLQPVAAAGPDPFTESTATSTEAPPPVTRTPQPTPTGSASADQAGVRSIEGSTPGLYGGTKSVSSCDVEQQVRFLTADRSKSRAFARAAGINQGDVVGWLRSLTPVQLRADTRVTNHGYQGGQATSFQSVLQRGTAVLVDNRGMPRVRCACGNPLTPPAELHKDAAHRGRPWQGYRPTNVIVVKPSTTVINNITIVNITNNTWIERPIGDDGDKDKVVPPPTPSPDVSPTPPDGSPSADPTGPDGSPSVDPSLSPTDTGPSMDHPDGQSTEPSTDDSGSPGTDDPTDGMTDGTSEEPTDDGRSPGPGESLTDPTDEQSASPEGAPTGCPSIPPTPTAPGGPTPTLPAGCPTPLPVPDTAPLIPGSGDRTLPGGDQDLNRPQDENSPQDLNRPQGQPQDPTDRTAIPPVPDEATVPEGPGDELGPESVPEVPDVEPAPDTPYIPDPTAPELFGA